MSADVSELPEIQEFEIEELCTSTNFKKGRALFDDEKLGELHIEGDLISAVCGEKSDGVAVPQARFNAAGINDTACTCAHSGGGLCRHRVALLLCLAHTPEKFERLEKSPEVVSPPAQNVIAPPKKKSDATLFEDLRKRDSDELAQIILSIVESEPKMKGVLRRLMQPRLSDGEIKKVRGAIESQINKVVRSYDPNVSLVRREIKLQLRSAQSLEATRPIDAGRLFAAILDGLISGGSEALYQDPGNVFSNAANECLAAINRIYPSATSDRRAQWLETVCGVFLMEIELGGIDFGEGSEEILLRATPDEWPIIEKRLDNFLEERAHRRRRTTIWSFTGAQEIEYSDDTAWSRETVVGLKTSWMARNGKSDLARQIVMKQGSSSQKVEIFLREKDFDAATEIAAKNFGRLPGLIHRFADDLLKAGEWQRAKNWAIQHKMVGWLADKCVERGESDALERLVDFFDEQSDFGSWNRALDYAQPAEREATRRKMWQILEKRGAYLTQFDIAVHLGEADSVLELWPKLNEIQKMGRQTIYAAAIENQHPEAALKAWNAAANRLIEIRSRESYQEAARALARVKKLMVDAGQEADFNTQITALKARYSMLRALHQELVRVGL